jgi:16S rRNA U516 pseudouridylate synthase RsuA-like enzyme
MMAAVGLPALRLIRERVGPWSLGMLQPGESSVMVTEEAWQRLKTYR